MKANEKAVYLEVDKELWKQVGILAAKQDTTIKEIASKAFTTYIKTKEETN